MSVLVGLQVRFYSYCGSFLRLTLTFSCYTGPILSYPSGCDLRLGVLLYLFGQWHFLYINIVRKLFFPSPFISFFLLTHNPFYNCLGLFRTRTVSVVIWTSRTYSRFALYGSQYSYTGGVLVRDRGVFTVMYCVPHCTWSQYCI